MIQRSHFFCKLKVLSPAKVSVRAAGSGVSMAYLGSFDSRQFRSVLGTFTTGVTVVTTRDARGNMHGVTANSFSSVSLDPPLVLWSQALTSRSFEAFKESDHFTVNVLADDQVTVSAHFAKSHEDKFANVAHREGLGGSPVLPGTSAHLECVKVATYPAGDHVIYIGRVERIGQSGRRPLAFAHGRYMVPYAHDLGPLSMQMGSAVAADALSLRIAAGMLPEISKASGHHTICLTVWGNHGTTAVQWEPGEHPVSYPLPAGLVMSTTRTAVGQAFAAFLPGEVTKPFVDEELRLFCVADEDEAAQRRAFEDVLAEVRVRGLARIVEAADSPIHRVAVNEFSVPVLDADGKVAMALGLTGSIDRLDSAWDGPVPRALQAAAQQLSRQLQANQMEVA